MLEASRKESMRAISFIELYGSEDPRLAAREFNFRNRHDNIANPGIPRIPCAILSISPARFSALPADAYSLRATGKVTAIEVPL
jgi:hypothetical protein